MSKTLNYSFVVILSFIVVRLHPYEQVSLSVNYKRKTWVLASACSIFWPTTAKLKTDKVNTHAGVYRYTVKCALRLHEPRSTLRSLIYTPRGSHLCIVLVQLSIVVVRISKNKASVTPFHNVVHRPRGSSLLKEYHSQWGNSFCKSTKKKTIIATFLQLFLLFLFYLRLCQRHIKPKTNITQSRTHAISHGY